MLEYKPLFTGPAGMGGALCIDPEAASKEL